MENREKSDRKEKQGCITPLPHRLLRNPGNHLKNANLAISHLDPVKTFRMGDRSRGLRWASQINMLV
jgi:hypothetical protein